MSENCRALLHQILAVGVDVRSRPRLEVVQMSPWFLSGESSVLTVSLSYQHQLQVAELTRSRLNLKGWSPENILKYVKGNKGLLGKTAGCYNILAQDFKRRLNQTVPSSEEKFRLGPSQALGSTPMTSKMTPVARQGRERRLEATASPNLLRGAGQHYGNQNILNSNRKDVEREGAGGSTEVREVKDRMADFNICQVIEVSSEDSSDLQSAGSPVIRSKEQSLKKRRRSSSVLRQQHQVKVDLLNSGRSKPSRFSVETKPFKYLDRNIRRNL